MSQIYEREKKPDKLDPCYIKSLVRYVWPLMELFQIARITNTPPVLLMFTGARQVANKQI